MTLVELVISETGGGLPGLVILALAYSVWTERRRTNHVIDRAMSREKQHSDQLVETIKAVETATEMLGKD